MKRKKKKITSSKLSLFHLFFISCSALLLAVVGVLLPKLSQRVGADTAGYYVPILVTPNPSTGTMQLQTLQFKFIAYTPTPTPPVQPGDSSGSGIGTSKGQQLASLATSLVNNIHKNCGAFVNASKTNCLNGIGPSGVVAQLKLNVSQDYSLQCAGFAQAVAIGIGFPIGNGDALTYAGKSIPGYVWIPNRAGATISVGDIPVWSGFGCQHIAVITQTFGQYSFRAAEANGEAGIFGPAGTVVFDNYGRGGFSSCSLTGWQHAI